MERDYCHKHNIPKNIDGLCPKCLEEKNNKNGTDNRKLQRVSSDRKRVVIENGK